MKYDYRCLDCKKRFEQEVVGMLRIEKRRPTKPKCPHCKSKSVKKLITVPNRIIKNAGSPNGGI